MAEIPFVSVIVPMYNSEKYIGELLDSLLAQTLKNFEVIISDDCSTDNSREIVESYSPKFEGRLKLVKLRKNTGAPSIPRNIGLEMSRGDYIYFLDSDDILTKTALEEMYTQAENFQADVVYCERYYMSEGIGEEFMKNIHIADDRIQSGGFVDEPTVISEDLKTRMDEWIDWRFWMSPCLRLSKRSFLIENHIRFPNTVQEDNQWAFEVLCLAKKFVRLPNICFIRRMRENSRSDSPKKINKFVREYSEKTVHGLKKLSDFMDKLEFFDDNPYYRYTVLRVWSMIDINSLNSADLQFHDLYKIFKDEFQNELGENDALISTLITNNVLLLSRLIAARKQISELTDEPFRK